MKKNASLCIMGILLAGAAHAGEGLYSVGQAPEKSIPLNWNLGSDFVYDDNVMPGGASNGQDAFGINPYLGVQLLSLSPQTIVNIYGRFGIMYYLDPPVGMDDTNNQSRLSLDITHDVNERVSLSTKNFVSYELEPNYAYGYAGSRQGNESLFWQSDNSVSYRWSERLATVTGVRVGGISYDNIANADQKFWEGYNQFRYSLSPQSIGTLEYRYKSIAGDGVASDSKEQFLLVGVDHNFTALATGILKAGVQSRDVTSGQKSTSPYMEASLLAKMNEQFLVRGFLRYGLEGYDTVQTVGVNTVEFDERKTFRLGLNGEYQLSQLLSVFGGVDYIPTTYGGGRVIPTNAAVADQSEDLLNTYIGLSMKFTDTITGTASYNYTDSNSDLAGRDYDRSRISVGVNARF